MANFFKALDLSTGHLTGKERYFLNSAEPFIVHETTYGWLVWVPEEALFEEWLDELEDVEENYALKSYVNLVAAVIYARSLGADFILFDSLGEIDENLLYFEDD